MEKRYVYAIRLFLKDGHMPMAELAMGEGGRPNGETVTIRWDVPAERDGFIINAYTFIWDERLPAKRTFNEFVHGQDAPNDEPANSADKSVTDEPFTIDNVPDAELRITEIQAILENDFDMSRREEAALVSEREDLEEKVNQVKTAAMLSEALAGVDGLISDETTGNGFYYCELYANYDDGFSERRIAEMIDSEDPAMAFYEAMDDAWQWNRIEELADIIDKVKSCLINLGVDSDYLDAAGDDEVRDYVFDHVDVRYPQDHYLDQEVCVNIVIDSGDGNYDYTINAQYPSSSYNAVRPAQPDEDAYVPYDMDTFISEKAGIAWLASTQGYTRGDLHRALMDDDIIPGDILQKLNSLTEPSPAISFLQSMHYEMANSCSSTPCVTFLVRMTLRQLLIINQLIREQDRNGRHYDASQNPECGIVTIGKNTMTGLFDFIAGGGSLFEISLEKDVDIPIRFIRSATPDIDECQGITWSVGNVYGMISNAWRDTILEIATPKELAKKICLFGGKINVIEAPSEAA